MFNKKEQFFCAFCRSRRKISLKKNVTFVEGTYCVLAAILLSLLFWQNFDVRILFIFGILLAITEVILQMRWRLAISCPYCGFDPVLYKKNKVLTAQRIKNHLERRKKDPHALFSKNFYLDLPRPQAPPPPTNIGTVKKGKKLDLSL